MEGTRPMRNSISSLPFSGLCSLQSTLGGGVEGLARKSPPGRLPGGLEGRKDALLGFRLHQREENGLADTYTGEEHNQAVDTQAQAAHGGRTVFKGA